MMATSTPDRRLPILHEAEVELLSDLRSGQRWLNRHHVLWTDDDPSAAGGETVSRILDEWDERDLVLRNLFSFEGCIWGEDQHCPDENVVDCRGCAK